MGLSWDIRQQLDAPAIFEVLHLVFINTLGKFVETMRVALTNMVVRDTDGLELIGGTPGVR